MSTEESCTPKDALQGLSSEEILQLEKRCTTKKIDRGKLNNLMEGKALQMENPIFILQVSSAEKKPQKCLESMIEKIKGIYLQSRKQAYEAIFVVSPTQISCLCIPSLHVNFDADIVPNRYLEQSSKQSISLETLHTDIQTLHRLWSAGEVDKELIKNALRKHPVKVFDNPSAYRNPFAQGSYTSATEKNNFALHFVHEEDFDNAVDLAHYIIEQYNTPSPLIPIAFLQKDKDFVCFYSSKIDSKDKQWIHKLSCEKEEVIFIGDDSHTEEDNTIVDSGSHLHSYDIGHQYENEAMQRLTNLGYAIVPTRSFFHNTGNIKAPMMSLPEGKLILPDILCFPTHNLSKHTPFPRSPFWLEVKYRSYPIWKDSLWYHAVRKQNWLDYGEVQHLTGIPVVILVQEGYSPTSIPQNNSAEAIQNACAATGVWFWEYISNLQSEPQKYHTFSDDPFAIWERQSMRLFDMSLFDDRTVETPVNPFEQHTTIELGSNILSLETSPKHSVILIDPHPNDALALLSSGIKVYWFTKDAPILSEELQVFTLGGGKYSGMLSIHCVHNFQGKPVIDGALTEDWTRFLESQQNLPKQGSFDSFNLGQYRVEHAPTEQHIQVQAGAGSGKTHILVQRILFLLAMDPTLAIEQIGLITFTRDATQEMKKRLINTLAMRFRLTQQPRFLSWLLKTTQMPILTIHSFGRRLIGLLGGGLNLSPDFALRSYLMEQRKYTHQCIQETLSPTDLSQLQKDLYVPLYKIENFIEDIWKKIKQKGLSLHDIQNINWGGAGSGLPETINDLFSKLFSEVEQKIRTEKQNSNTLELSDLTRILQDQMSQFSEMSQQKALFRYLFIDEFQDTDPVQIQVIDSLQEALGLWVCVIGDIKQSIYRFRGADYTSFDQIEERFERRQQSFLKRTLSRNYRTEKGVLENIESKFQVWNRKGLLQYTPSDRLVAEQPNPGNIEVYSYDGKDDAEKHLETIIEKAFSLEEEYRKANKRTPKRGDVVALVRTNKEADALQTFCHNHGIPCTYDKSGDFFRSDATREFIILVRALLYPKEPIHIFNLMHSSYSQSTIHWLHFWKSQGNKESILNQLDALKWTPHPSWNTLLEKKRTLPVLALLLKAIRELKPTDRYYFRLLDKKPEHWTQEDWEQKCTDEAKIYHANLYKLLTIFQNNSSADFVSLHSIESWLSVQQATEFDEHDCELTDEIEYNRHLTIMTVHKSKGLEFSTVILPYTHRTVFKGTEGFVLHKNDGEAEYSLGWSMKNPHKAILFNDLYASLNTLESNEERKEEARILYVALTRTIRHLLINRCKSAKNHWGSLLEESSHV